MLKEYHKNAKVSVFFLEKKNNFFKDVEKELKTVKKIKFKVLQNGLKK